MPSPDGRRARSRGGRREEPQRGRDAQERAHRAPLTVVLRGGWVGFQGWIVWKGIFGHKNAIIGSTRRR